MSPEAHTLVPFDALIGTWTIEATRPLLGDVVPGSVPFGAANRRDEAAASSTDGASARPH